MRGSRKAQGGSMLLEALIAIVIFSIGVLALVRMQAFSISHMSDARFRTEAGFLANRVIAQMWSNRNNLASYAYAGGAAPPVLADWLTEVQNTLPDVAANPPQIVIGAGNVVTVTVFWRPPSAPTPHNYIVVATVN